MKKAPIIRLGSIIVIVIIAGCSHEHEILPHDHEILPHDHEVIAADTPVEIVSISEPNIYIPDVVPNDNVGSICSAKVHIVFSSVPLNAVLNAGIQAYNSPGQEVSAWNVVDRKVWWEQDRETVAIYFYIRTSFGIDNCKLSGVIQWQSGRKHFEVTIDEKRIKRNPR